MEDNPTHTSRGAELETSDFDQDIATTKCLGPKNGKLFQSFTYNWLAHLIHQERLHEFGQCRIFVYSDEGCTDTIQWIDEVSCETSHAMSQH